MLIQNNNGIDKSYQIIIQYLMKFYKIIQGNIYIFFKSLTFYIELLMFQNSLTFQVKS